MKKILFAALALSAALPAHAALITFTDRAAFLAATTTKSVTTFEGIASSGAFQAYGTSYNAGVFSATGGDLYIISSSYSPDLTPGNTDGLFQNSQGSTTTFTVAGGTTAFGVDIGDYYNQTSQTFASSAGSVVLSVGKSTPGFFGFISDSALTSFTFTNVSEYDNVTLASPAAAAVPEPAMLGLFGLGAAGLIAARRRKAA